MYEALIGGVWTGISQTWATTSVPDGVYDLRVVVADVAGNSTTSAVVAGRRVDNTPPDTSHNAPAGWQSGSTTVALSPSDGGSGVANTQYSVDGGGWNSGTSVNVSGDGIHTISFFSTDVAGNIESPKTATVMIDSTPPDPGANDPGNYLRGTVTLTASPSTGGPGGADVTQVEFQHKRSSDSTWTSLGVDTTDPYSATWATSAADDGSWDLRFIVTDEAANTNTTDLPSKIVDNTAPTGNVASPLSGSTVSGKRHARGLGLRRQPDRRRRVLRQRQLDRDRRQRALPDELELGVGRRRRRDDLRRDQRRRRQLDLDRHASTSPSTTLPQASR